MSNEIKLKIVQANKLCEFDKGFIKGFICQPKIKKYYPKILDWLDNVVYTSSDKKIIFATENEGDKLSFGLPVGIAIVKPGKICHCSVNQDHFNKGIGASLFGLALEEAKNYGNGLWKVRFTLPSVLWETHRNFFKLFGFDRVTVCTHNYRSGKIKELRCERKFKDNLH